MNALTDGIYNKLTGGTALTSLLSGGTASPAIFYQQAPDNQPFPFVVFNVQGGGDLNVSPSRLKEVLIYARAYSNVSANAAGAIDAQIDALLHGGTVTVSGYANYAIQRETDVENVETTANAKIYTAGGVYRFYLDS